MTLGAGKSPLHLNCYGAAAVPSKDKKIGRLHPWKDGDGEDKKQQSQTIQES